jgi:hypothetical protein
MKLQEPINQINNNTLQEEYLEAFDYHTQDNILENAFKYNHINEIQQYAINKNDVISYKIENFIYDLICKNSSNCANSLFIIFKNKNITTKQHNYFLHACIINKIEIVSLFLLNLNFNINIKFTLTNAIFNSNDNFIYLLINNNKINIIESQNSPILTAFECNRMNIVQALWERTEVKKSLKKDNESFYKKMLKYDIKEKLIYF